MTCPHCDAPGLTYQTPTLYFCPLCGGYASLVGVPMGPIKPDPPLVKKEDFDNLDERLESDGRGGRR